MRKFYVHLLLLLGTGLLQGCGSAYKPPVDELGGEQRFLNAGRTHRVNAGETLYMIAWIYDLDYRDLAQVNDLNEPFSLSAGQQLLVDLRGMGTGSSYQTGSDSDRRNIDRQPQTTNGSQTVVVRAAEVPATLTRSTLPSAGVQRTPLPEQAITAPATSVPEPPRKPVQEVAVSESTIAQTQSKPAPVKVVTSVKPASQPVPATLPKNDAILWSWPTEGKLIGRFSLSDLDKKGLDIAGTKGQAIKAAADGQVVYTGSDVLHYGDLVILKHNDQFLSAYAHNSRILVQEGDVVRSGDTIAELGDSGIDKNMLHFEIRKQGTPVNPLDYLPAR